MSIGILDDNILLCILVAKQTVWLLFIETETWSFCTTLFGFNLIGSRIWEDILFAFIDIDRTKFAIEIKIYVIKSKYCN